MSGSHIKISQVPQKLHHFHFLGRHTNQKIPSRRLMSLSLPLSLSLLAFIVRDNEIWAYSSDYNPLACYSVVYIIDIVAQKECTKCIHGEHYGCSGFFPSMYINRLSHHNINFFSPFICLSFIFVCLKCNVNFILFVVHWISKLLFALLSHCPLGCTYKNYKLLACCAAHINISYVSSSVCFFLNKTMFKSNIIHDLKKEWTLQFFHTYTYKLLWVVRSDIDRGINSLLSFYLPCSIFQFPFFRQSSPNIKSLFVSLLNV